MSDFGFFRKKFKEPFWRVSNTDVRKLARNFILLYFIGWRDVNLDASRSVTNY